MPILVPRILVSFIFECFCLLFALLKYSWLLEWGKKYYPIPLGRLGTASTVSTKCAPTPTTEMVRLLSHDLEKSYGINLVGMVKNSGNAPKITFCFPIPAKCSMNSIVLALEITRSMFHKTYRESWRHYFSNFSFWRKFFYLYHFLVGIGINWRTH